MVWFYHNCHKGNCPAPQTIGLEKNSSHPPPPPPPPATPPAPLPPRGKLSPTIKFPAKIIARTQVNFSKTVLAVN